MALWQRETRDEPVVLHAIEVRNLPATTTNAFYAATT